jgi:hypothetical protein
MVVETGESGEIFLLHAGTIFEGDRKLIPWNTVSGNIYDLASLKEKGCSEDNGFGEGA